MIAKIEKVEAYEDLDEIVRVADGVMVARGDYGVQVMITAGRAGMAGGTNLIMVREVPGP